MIDAALTQRRCDVAELQCAAGRLAGRSGIRTAQAAIAAGRSPVDSAQETYLRLLLVDNGIPDSDIDVGLTLVDDAGVVLARGDLGCRRLMIWGEYDGYREHTGRPAFATDRTGDRWLERRGWHVLRFSAADMGRPERVAGEWRAAMRAAPRRIQAMDPARSPELAQARQALATP